MKSPAKNISLTSLDDLFATDESRAEAAREKVLDIPLDKLHEFPNHPFKVRDDESMKNTVESVEKYGVLVPAIVREREDGEYEIIAGHRRHHASVLAGRETLPCLVRDLDDDEATIFMVDTNLQREEILPSERAAAYKMKLEAIKRQGARHDLTCTQVGYKLQGKKSIDIVAEDSGESSSQVQRLIRLTELVPELSQMVDDKKIGLTPAVELSGLTKPEQKLLIETMESEDCTPSLSQAQRMKKLSQQGELNEDTMLAIMSEQKKPPQNTITLTNDKLSRFFPKSYTPQKMEEVILKLLENWARKRQRDMER